MGLYASPLARASPKAGGGNLHRLASVAQPVASSVLRRCRNIRPSQQGAMLVRRAPSRHTTYATCTIVRSKCSAWSVRRVTLPRLWQKDSSYKLILCTKVGQGCASKQAKEEATSQRHQPLHPSPNSQGSLWGRPQAKGGKEEERGKVSQKDLSVPGTKLKHSNFRSPSCKSKCSRDKRAGLLLAVVTGVPVLETVLVPPGRHHKALGHRLLVPETVPTARVGQARRKKEIQSKKQDMKSTIGLRSCLVPKRKVMMSTSPWQLGKSFVAKHTRPTGQRARRVQTPFATSSFSREGAASSESSS